ncbi:MAG TPA: phosphoglucosamine mutase [Ferrovibrio sp.]|jgi:phosphoglucosamine mutase|uniref:phosphoglucosamine mutase n=1 Tax=Ferrovibrio sp. TaxID=1917215 RepID=UPI002B4B3B34|nr:phosphoglucosamine mutase [Ferrovibrio sp.]HLT78377.1 phosphoglucosamine mutase [Ferrovibrio sp.]
MGRKFFGTDGIRGLANTEPMTPATALRVGMAAGAFFTRGDHRHRVLIGKDTRLSGYMLEPALVAGFTAVGMDVFLVGPMPTPAVAMLTRALRCDLGVMISASHNPFHDNGIKLFGPDGYKLSDQAEREIEAMITGDAAPTLAAPEKLGRAKRLDDADGRYIEFAKATLPKGKTLKGLKVVVDCANGAAYKVAPTVLWELEAEVIPIGVHPDGFNINRQCGSTHPDLLQAAVISHGADLGLALDGDADRLVMVDERGAVIDGDQLMAVIAESWLEQGRLPRKGMAATVMSNLGLERFVNNLGIELKRTKVGDRYVLEAMREEGFNLGGEQSGHIILSDFATTGDGLIAGLQVMAALVESGKKASEFCRRFTPFPQLLRNVRHSGGAPLDKPSVQSAIAAAEKALGSSGRIVIRPSGTEPLIRVMAEGEDRKLVEAVVGDIVTALEQAAA